ncbi:hypothetical protein HAX54_023995 [Datura stramonium]|uniref:Uncharacterized protein n=1 Tax=Datura stramonium TaxID=4076 RepID=A0ABS8UZQ8_DATST|nr:hypothetical protein [Datura stramonium]
MMKSPFVIGPSSSFEEKYVEPSQKLSKNRTKPRMNRDPLGNIDMTFLPRTEEENAPFVELGLRSSFVTLRHDDDLIVEPYSPHRFSRQFGFCQDVPGVLIEHHYDGSLLALVHLWDSCVHLGSLSSLIIPMRPSDEGPLMTREYSDWWPIHRGSVLRRSTHIILRGPRKDDSPSATKEGQP